MGVPMSEVEWDFQDIYVMIGSIQLGECTTSIRQHEHDEAWQEKEV